MQMVNLMWLSGSPGSGKLTIAVTLAKQLLERDRLTASFSFQRNRVTDPPLFWRTIAYRIALSKSDQTVEQPCHLLHG
jgi:tRNA uridine 5-carbamoylmethylation protein Kti12